jgi:hypothetical protein
MKDWQFALIAGALGSYFLLRNSGKYDFEKNVRDINAKPLPRQAVSNLTPAEAGAIAERQHKAMNRPGYNGNDLFSAINDLNGAELRQVYEAYGLRRYSWFVGDKDLFQWYVLELSRPDLSRMKILWYKAGLTF